MPHLLLQIQDQVIPGWESPAKTSLFKGVKGDILFSNKLDYFFTHSEMGILLFCSLLMLGLYYWLAFSMGRNVPVKPPQFLDKPPLGLSPAAMRYISEMGFDTKCLVVAIMNASIKGCYEIAWRNDRFQARHIPGANVESLSNDERLALTYREDAYWERVIVGNSHSTKTRKMSKRMDKFLKKKYGQLFTMKRDWLLGGIFMSVFLGGLLMSVSEASHGVITWLGFNFVMWIGLIIPGFFLYISIRDRYWYGLGVSIFYLGAGIAALYFIEKLSNAPFVFIAAFPMLAINFTFYQILPTYTHRGARMMNLILAYKNYLEHRFSEAVDQDSSQRHLEELPYAMALDLEYHFTGYFKKILSRTKYTPYRVFDYIYR